MSLGKTRKPSNTEPRRMLASTHIMQKRWNSLPCYEKQRKRKRDGRKMLEGFGFSELFWIFSWDHMLMKFGLHRDQFLYLK